MRGCSCKFNWIGQLNAQMKMLCHVIILWLFVKRLSQKAIQRRSQRDRLVKIKVTSAKLTETREK